MEKRGKKVGLGKDKRKVKEFGKDRSDGGGRDKTKKEGR